MICALAVGTDHTQTHFLLNSPSSSSFTKCRNSPSKFDSGSRRKYEYLRSALREMLKTAKACRFDSADQSTVQFCARARKFKPKYQPMQSKRTQNAWKEQTMAICLWNVRLKLWLGAVDPKVVQICARVQNLRWYISIRGGEWRNWPKTVKNGHFAFKRLI